MALLDAIEPDPLRRAELEPVLRRRARYLASRADAVMEREVGSNAVAEPWRRQMTAATLWLEAAESSTALADFGAARSQLHKAVLLLLQLDLPFGVALQRSLLPAQQDIGRLANEVQRRWEMHAAEADRESNLPMWKDKAVTGAIPHARQSPQQWTYVLLSSATSNWADPDDLGVKLRKSHGVTEQAPIGRMRQPMNYYQFISSFSARMKSAPREEADTNDATVMEVLSKSITGVYRALNWASGNEYLWRRMLAPAPLFDLDTAVLIGTVIDATAHANPELADRAAAFGTAEDVALYAREFVLAVRALRG
jgi:hypothetical protein